MFFNIERWIFQYLFEIEFRETSQTYSGYSENCYLHFSIGCLIEFNFYEVSQNPFTNRSWKFQLSILKNKKRFIYKKKFFLGCCQYQNKKLCLLTQFSGKVLTLPYNQIRKIRSLLSRQCFILGPDKICLKI